MIPATQATHIIPFIRLGSEGNAVQNATFRPGVPRAPVSLACRQAVNVSRSALHRFSQSGRPVADTPATSSVCLPDRVQSLAFRSIVDAGERAPHGEPSLEALCFFDFRVKDIVNSERARYQTMLDRQNGLASRKNRALLLGMASSNMLARRNGYGQALCFLSNLRTFDNHRYLSSYLIGLHESSFLREHKAYVAQQVQLAAYYLIKTDWFASGRNKHRAILVLHLGRYPHDALCLRAIDAIAKLMCGAPSEPPLVDITAGRVLDVFARQRDSADCAAVVARLSVEGDVRTYSPRRYAKALRALSRFRSDPCCRAATLKLTEHLNKHQSLRDALHVQDMSHMLNSFSTWSDEPACRSASGLLAHRLLNDPMLCDTMQIVDLCHLLISLGHQQNEPLCRSVACLLAARLVIDPLEGLCAADVARALNGVGRWPDAPDCQRAAVSVAKKVADRPDLIHQLTEREFANTLTGLGKWPQQRECRHAAMLLIGHFEQTPSLMNGMSAQSRSMTLHNMSKWPDDLTVQRSLLALVQTYPVRLDGPSEITLVDVEGSVSALGKWPDVVSCRRLIFSLAGYLCVNPHLFTTISPRQTANLLNSLSRWPGELTCQRVLEALMACLTSRPELALAMNSLDLAVALNGLRQCPESAARTAAIAQVAQRINDENGETGAMDGADDGPSVSALRACATADTPAVDITPAMMSLAMACLDRAVIQRMSGVWIADALNVLGRSAQDVHCRDGAISLAECLLSYPELTEQMNAQGIANALNALGKWPEAQMCKLAVSRLAARLGRDRQLVLSLSAQGIANTLNGLGKWPSDVKLLKTVCRLATWLCDDTDVINELNAQGVANTLNGLGKWPSEPSCGEAVALLAVRLRNDDALVTALTAQGMANALNALSKWPNEARCRDAMYVLARRLTQDEDLVQALTAQGMANALNALGKLKNELKNKLPDEAERDAMCDAAAMLLATQVSTTPALVTDLTEQGLANVLNACSKWAARAPSQDVSRAIARRLNQSPELVAQFTAQGLANAIKALRRWPDQRDCREALVRLAAETAMSPSPSPSPSTAQAAAQQAQVPDVGNDGAQAAIDGTATRSLALHSSHLHETVRLLMAKLTATRVRYDIA